ncbi:MAG: chondroitinase-B domain-containing protein, partial [Bacteroidota bacterium]
MGKRIIFRLSFWSLVLCFLLSSCSKTEGLVRTEAEFQQAVKAAQAGDKIVLANGVWKDVELVFTGTGTAEQPIVLTVEQKGKVTLEGQSNLSIAGKYLQVEGLVFKNGYTPTKEVISFRKNKEELCHHCRVTECVIDNYNNPERFESDYWVSIYGKNNRFDHNYLTGKRNHGVTLAVRLNTEESRENYNRIDHNYFGHRPILGANGGETLRIGTSHHSLTNSNTIVEYNYFDRCNGEHEIISSKSCQNIYRHNTFYECQGTLTMRHGNETLVESNYFFGNGKSNTGGIRIINETQKVVNNYCEGLTGYRFRGALVIMNGVPNSPLNRYFQVINSTASNNTFVNCDHIQLCAGSDEERSAVPMNTKVENNLFYHDQKKELFTIYDDISGISFAGNLIPENSKPITESGFQKASLSLKRNADGLLMPQGEDAKGKGMTPSESRATPDNTGVRWYPRVAEEVRFGRGRTIVVKAGDNTLYEAIQKSNDGDVLVLETGTYVVTKAIDITHPISIISKADSNQKPLIQFQRTSLFNIENGGSLSLKNVVVDGSEAPDAHGNTVIRTSRYSMSRNYKLFIEDCDFKDLDINHTFDVLRVYKNTFADSIVLRNSTFTKVDGNVLALNKETDDIGIYNAENVVIENCRFRDVSGVVLHLHRGGRDESTFGPMLVFDKCILERVGQGKRNKTKASLALHGVQVAHIQNSQFKDCKPLNLHLVVGEPITKIQECSFENTGKIEDNGEPYETKH